jgi:restriction system protein
MARENARVKRAHERAHAQRAAAQRRAVREAQIRTKADAKEAARAYEAGQKDEADELTREVRAVEQAIEGLLRRALAANPAVNLDDMRTPFTSGEFDESPWQLSKPELAAYLPQPPGFIGRLIPGADGRHQRNIENGTKKHAAAHQAYLAERAARDISWRAFQQAEERRKAAWERENDKINAFQRELNANEHSAVLAYFKLVFDKSLRGEPDALSAEIGYSPDSKHLVVDLELPEFSIIPEESGFKYVKAGDRIDPIARKLPERKALYSSLLSQISLKCVDTVFRADNAGVVECLTLNGMLDTIDPATGQQVRVCLISVRVDADTFRGLNLHQVQPEHCLRSLKASVSRAPTELAAVKPIIELDMVDPRFVETMDVLSGLDQRPNLMDLSPTEFEGLITNLFGKMGLDTRQTRPSRDGGVDCVAFDPRPVFGGKVVIQAKRYKNTVGVSAVRDLFGTVQNEGASKGILVTTSGYGKAAFEFARGKPLELLDGSNLLHLLSEHADTEARIVMPDGWVDLPIHGE